MRELVLWISGGYPQRKVYVRRSWGRIVPGLFQHSKQPVWLQESEQEREE